MLLASLCGGTRADDTGGATASGLSAIINNCQTQIAAGTAPPSVLYHDHITLGLAYAALGLPDKDIAEQTAAIAIEPHQPAALAARAEGYWKLRQLQPGFADALYGRGLAEEQKGQAAGTRDIAQAKSIDPDAANKFGQP